MVKIAIIIIITTTTIITILIKIPTSPPTATSSKHVNPLLCVMRTTQWVTTTRVCDNTILMRCGRGGIETSCTIITTTSASMSTSRTPISPHSTIIINLVVAPLAPTNTTNAIKSNGNNFRKPLRTPSSLSPPTSLPLPLHNALHHVNKRIIIISMHKLVGMGHFPLHSTMHWLHQDGVVAMLYNIRNTLRLINKNISPSYLIATPHARTSSSLTAPTRSFISHIDFFGCIFEPTQSKQHFLSKRVQGLGCFQ